MIYYFVIFSKRTYYFSRKNAQLESELREAEQRMTNSMSCSIAPVREDTVRQLQQENKQLKDQLSKSMTTAINNDKEPWIKILLHSLNV